MSRFTEYTTSELARAANAPKLSTATRIAMLDEIQRREAEEAEMDDEHASEERRRLEAEEMNRHFEKHPHG